MSRFAFPSSGASTDGGRFRDLDSVWAAEKKVVGNTQKVYFERVKHVLLRNQTREIKIIVSDYNSFLTKNITKIENKTKFKMKKTLLKKKTCFFNLFCLCDKNFGFEIIKVFGMF